MTIPYLPSFQWYRDSMERGLPSLRKEKAINRSLVGISSPTRLTVPLIKGSGGLISSHGNWQHVHLGTINAIYGRTPYFQHLYPELEEILRNTPEDLATLNLRLHAMICRWLEPETMEALRSLTPESPNYEALRQEATRLATNINFNLSILDPLFRFGKNTVLPLVLYK